MKALKWILLLAVSSIGNLYGGCGPEMSQNVGSSMESESMSSTEGQILPGEKFFNTPHCPALVGMPRITYLKDPNEKFRLNLTPPRQGFTAVGAMVAFQGGRILVAQYENNLYRSFDAGCVWLHLATLSTNASFHFVSASEDYAYALDWNGSERQGFWMLDINGVQHQSDLPADVLHIAVDPNNPAHVRVATSNGHLFDSTNRGVSWTMLGNAIPGAEDWFFYSAAIDPTDLDHVIFGLAGIGAWVSLDAGRSWQQSDGLGPIDSQSRVNVFSLAISPAKTQIVWAEGLVFGVDSERKKRIFRSEDGGLSFSPVVDQTEDITLSNGIKLYPHPRKTDVVFFAHGIYSPAVVKVGVWLYQYDHSQRKTTWNYSKDYFGINDILFNPTDPNVMFLGLLGVTGEE